MARPLSQPLTKEECIKLSEVKAELCRQLRRSMNRTSHPSPDRIAHQLGTSKACVLRVQCARTDELTINQLFRYLVRLEPNFRFIVSI